MIKTGLARCGRNHHWDGVFPSNLDLEGLARPITDLDLGETDSSPYVCVDVHDSASRDRRDDHLIVPSARLCRRGLCIGEANLCRLIARLEHNAVQVPRA